MACESSGIVVAPVPVQESIESLSVIVVIVEEGK